MKINDAEVYAVYGRRGSGKSYMVKKMMKAYDRVIVLDPMGEYLRLPGFKSFDNIEAMHSHIIKNWKKGFKVSLSVTRNVQKGLHELCLYVHELQRDATRKVMLVAEELSAGYPSRGFKDRYYGFPEILLRGRHRGIEIIGVSQRPNNVLPNFRSMVSETFIFPLEDDDDIKWVGRKIGRHRLPEYLNMKPFHHIRTGGGKYEITKA